MIRGTYRFYQDGVLLSEQTNLLTIKGKQQVLRLLSSQIAKLGESIAVGVSGTTATTSDDALSFELARTKISVSSPDFVNNKIVFKGTLPGDISGIIYEVGLWSLLNNAYSGTYESKVLVSFDSANEFWPSGASWQTANARIGIDALRLAPLTSATANLSLSGVALDLLGYSDADQFKLAYWVQNAFCANVKLKFMTTVSDYYTYTITTPSSGYHMQSFGKGNFTSTGSPTWSNITTVDVSATATAGGACNVDFDGIRIEDTDSYNPEYFLISRAVLVSPITKNPYSPMDIEYTLDAVIS